MTLQEEVFIRKIKRFIKYQLSDQNGKFVPYKELEERERELITEAEYENIKAWIKS